MTESNEHTQKILDAVFDENISEILAEMESSPKNSGLESWLSVVVSCAVR